jgi:hypothetical protein
MISNKLAAASIFFCLLIAFYVGTASLVTVKHLADYEEAKKLEQLSSGADSVRVIYDGLIFKNKAEMNKFVDELKYVNVNKWFNWSDTVPFFLLLILGACSFGLLGVIMKMLYEHIFAIKKIEDNNYIALPLLGFLSGFLSIGLSYLLPNIFLEGSALINPVGLILFSLLFGFFIKEFIQLLATKLFISNKTE